MLYFRFEMPVVFVIARDWTLRSAVRAELRESGDVLGMETGDEAGRAVASGQIPSVIVLEATARLGDDAAIQQLVRRVPTLAIASRTETLSLPPLAAVLYGPVRIAEIVTCVREIIAKGHAA